MMRFLLPTALAVALLTSSAEATDYHEIGLGFSSCGSWTEARSNQTTAFAYGQWVVGFLSGIGYEGTQYGGGQDSSGLCSPSATASSITTP